mmetsp:Transcript_80694/g.164240  ORF Transcript_80694/g.164240 Transcript_80694/m.164240 type:complete len:301 (-) Transcript_80694:458-1360(-)
MEVVEAAPPVEDGRRQHPPSTRRPVHREGVDGIIDLQHLQPFRSCKVHSAPDHGNEASATTFHVATSCRDRYQACQDAVAHTGNVIFLLDDVSDYKDADATTCCSNGGVHRHLCSHKSRGNVTQAKSGTAIEAVPSKPKDQGAKHHQGQTMCSKVVLWQFKASLARPSHGSAHQRSDAAGHVGDAAAGKIHEAGSSDGRQEAVPPGPGYDDRVHEAGHQEGEDTVAEKVHTLRDAATDNRGRGRTEGPLKEPIRHIECRLNAAVAIEGHEASTEPALIAKEAVLQNAIVGIRSAVGQSPS